MFSSFECEMVMKMVMMIAHEALTFCSLFFFILSVLGDFTKVIHPSLTNQDVLDAEGVKRKAQRDQRQLGEI